MKNLFESVLLMVTLGVITYTMGSILIDLFTKHQDKKIRETLKVRHMKMEQKIQEKRDNFEIFKERVERIEKVDFVEEENDCLKALDTYLLTSSDEKVEEKHITTDEFWEKCTPFSKHIHHGETSPEEADDEYFEELARQKASLFYEYQQKPLPNLAERLKDYTIEDVINAFAV